MANNFDVLVVGGGHAGIEAAAVCSRMGKNTILVTNNRSRIGFMSCNPSIGGLAKGHMVKEIDAFGGLMPISADVNCVQFKRLNSRKGPAVRGSRAQQDKELYSKFVYNKLSEMNNLKIIQGEVVSLLLDSNQVLGVKLEDDCKILSKTVILCTGTFLNAVMHIGNQKIPGGRVGDRSSIGLSDQLLDSGFEVQRLKTGTPARLLRSSIDFSKTEAQTGDEKFYPFSIHGPKERRLPQIECYLTHTNSRTHDIIRKNLHLSPMFSGEINGKGPRYCPSIEDKITRFADKERHQSFLEPEGIDCESIYLQGISTSLPEDVQIAFLQSIPGLENVRLIRPGYAVEYDCIEPRQLKRSLESKNIENLFFAGQVNGTSGYEEAAAQGLIAGINACRKIDNNNPFHLERHEAYIGVLIDDLVSKGTREPYRMFTSRAEYRLNLREDNTYERLNDLAYSVGCLPTQKYDKVNRLIQSRQEYMTKLSSHKLYPTLDTQVCLSKIPTPDIKNPLSLAELLKRSEVNTHHLFMFGDSYKVNHEVAEPVEIEIKYAGYIQKQNVLISQANRLKSYKIPIDLDYSKIKGLSAEEIEKLVAYKPDNLGQASRLSGINPSAIQSLMIFLKAYKPPKEDRNVLRRTSKF